MTAEQEKIAEKVIKIHKDNNGIYDWISFVDVFKTTNNDRIVIARGLRDKDIICDHTTGTRLKEQGWDFKGFEADRQKDLLNQKKQERKDQSDALDLDKKSWEYKYRRLPYFISGTALLATLFSIIFNFSNLTKSKKDQQDLQLMKEQIRIMKQKMNENELLFCADSLRRKHSE